MEERQRFSEAMRHLHDVIVREMINPWAIPVLDWLEKKLRRWG